MMSRSSVSGLCVIEHVPLTVSVDPYVRPLLDIIDDACQGDLTDESGHRGMFESHLIFGATWLV